MSEKRSGVRKVASLADEMHVSITKLAGERGWFDSRESWLNRAARRAGISYRSAKSIFYRESQFPHSSIVERVRIAVQQLDRQHEAKARVEHTELLERIARLEAKMAQTDPDFFEPQASGLREALRAAGGTDRAVDQVRAPDDDIR